MTVDVKLDKYSNTEGSSTICSQDEGDCDLSASRDEHPVRVHWTAEGHLLAASFAPFRRHSVSGDCRCGGGGGGGSGGGGGGTQNRTAGMRRLMVTTGSQTTRRSVHFDKRRPKTVELDYDDDDEVVVGGRRMEDCFPPISSLSALDLESRLSVEMKHRRISMIVGVVASFIIILSVSMVALSLHLTPEMEKLAAAGFSVVLKKSIEECRIIFSTSRVISTKCYSATSYLLQLKDNSVKLKEKVHGTAVVSGVSVHIADIITFIS